MDKYLLSKGFTGKERPNNETHYTRQQEAVTLRIIFYTPLAGMKPDARPYDAAIIVAKVFVPGLIGAVTPTAHLFSRSFATAEEAVNAIADQLDVLRECMTMLADSLVGEENA